jgi:hypothetical protein
MMRCFICFFLCTAFEANVAAQTFPIPWSSVLAGSDTSDEGSYTLAPFSYGGSRYQQSYSSSLFPGSAYGVSGIWISNIAFRLDATNGVGGPRNYAGVQINLSTTQRQPSSLDPVFANNIGTNDTVVFGP